MAIKLKTSSKASKPQIKKREYSSTPWIITCCVAVVLAITGSIGFYFLGRMNGYDDGIGGGYSMGYNDGYNDGDQNSYSRGFSAGRTVGYDTGYTDGYNDMWKKANCIISGGGSYCL